ncbi:MAG: hypothetical protein H0V67_10560, partial [Geodermatophilaceae bacterium]|nr:hypothetical protein [Geodermatophilaceae bacterium]
TALTEHEETVAGEVLATSYVNAHPPDAELRGFTVEPAVTFWLTRAG